MGGTTRTKSMMAALLCAGLVATACGGGNESAGEGSDAGSDVATDFGADDDTIRVGLLADMSGPFSPFVQDIVLAQEVYWERVNEAGGIAGRQIEMVVEDTRYDVPTHAQQFQELAAEDDSGVLLISQSSGSPHTANIAQELIDRNLVAIPLSWYSGWPDPDFGQNVLETYSNFCFESMNGIQFIADQGAETVAIVSFAGEAGQDSATGAKLAADDLGLEVVYDGEGDLTAPTPTDPNPDNSGVGRAIADADPDWVWLLANPSTLAQVMGQAASQGYEGRWAGNYPTYDDQLLTSDVADLIDSSYWASTFAVPFGADVPGMEEMTEAIREARPDASASDAYVYGWTEAQVTDAILRQAAANGDLTREGVVDAVAEVPEVDFGGLAPPQSWQGDPDDYIVRETYIVKPRLDLFTEGPIGTGSTGAELIEGPFASEVAQGYDYAREGACFDSQG